MGACQDCWVWSAEGGRIRACTTPVADGMALFTEPQPPIDSQPMDRNHG
jgi:NADH dehydrogenase/NADH:ubiquinone oxidoreductase subunit G